MSRSDTRTDDIRTLNQGTGGTGARNGSSRLLPPSDALKRDARQFLNTAEYEFRKVVGAARSASTPQEPEQAPAQEKAPRRKPEADQG